MIIFPKCIRVDAYASKCPSNERIAD